MNTKHHPHHDHDHDHDHDHPHDHEHDHEHDHDHSQNPILHWLQHLFSPHTHGHQTAALDAALSTERGIWALKISFAGLMVTAIMQVFVVMITNSVALLADTIHNFSDALTAIPLGLAFTLARRARNRRYTYGYGRAEDIAGVIIVLMIFASAVEVFYESIKKIIHPEPVTQLGWLAAAAIIGFLGNELVAIFRIKVGREIGSAALIADGLHARTDGLTSLGVLAGAIGVWIGFPLADPIMGILIGLTILMIVWGAARDMWYRMMDAVDPELYALIHDKAATIQGVQEVHGVAVRWVGHRLRSELHITVDCKLPTVESHRIAEDVRHEIFHELPAMVEITVHVDPCPCDEEYEYHPTDHHAMTGAYHL
jgi:cation diffusion facilitator family transporter